MSVGSEIYQRFYKLYFENTMRLYQNEKVERGGIPLEITFQSELMPPTHYMHWEFRISNKPIDDMEYEVFKNGNFQFALGYHFTTMEDFKSGKMMTPAGFRIDLNHPKDDKERELIKRIKDDKIGFPAYWKVKKFFYDNSVEHYYKPTRSSTPSIEFEDKLNS